MSCERSKRVRGSAAERWSDRGPIPLFERAREKTRRKRDGLLATRSLFALALPARERYALCDRTPLFALASQAREKTRRREMPARDPIPLFALASQACERTRHQRWSARDPIPLFALASLARTNATTSSTGERTVSVALMVLRCQDLAPGAPSGSNTDPPSMCSEPLAMEDPRDLPVVLPKSALRFIPRRL